MKRVLMLIAGILSWLMTSGQQIQSMEYFLDVDPGWGSGTLVPITPSAAVNCTFNIPLDAMEEGFHVVYLRVKNDQGAWSLTSTLPFFCHQTIPQPEIADIEFFLDSDPGHGNGQSVEIMPSQLSVSQNILIPLDGVAEGFHTLYLRTRDSNGKWSTTQTFPFFNIGDMPANYMQACEYFFDTDPGEGNGINVELPSGVSVISKNFMVDASCLLPGQHKLYIRVRDDMGRWSVVFYDDVDITIGEGVITASGETDLCAGDSVRLTTWAGECISFQWNKNGLPIEGATDSVYYAKQTGDYTVTLLVDASVVISNMIHVEVFPFLTVSLGDTDTISPGTAFLLNPQIAGGLPPYTCTWNDGSNAGYKLAVLSSTETIYVTVTDFVGCSSSAGITIGVDQSTRGSVSGFVTYKNEIESALPGTLVSLVDNNVIVRSTFTNTEGVYCFSNVEPGDYDYLCTADIAWGGVNSIDALLILKHFVNLSLLTGLNKLAANLDNNPVINSTDALYVSKRFVELITSFPQGDWRFETGNVSVSSNLNTLNNFHGLCNGDVDGSYIFIQSK